MTEMFSQPPRQPQDLDESEKLAITRRRARLDKDTRQKHAWLFENGEDDALDGATLSDTLQAMEPKGPEVDLRQRENSLAVTKMAQESGIALYFVALLLYTLTSDFVMLFDICVMTDFALNLLKRKELEKHTSLHHAITHKNYPAIVTLLSDGAPTDNFPKDNTTLHQAVSYGDKQAASLLLDAGANPHQKNDENISPLHSAIQVGDKEMVALILEKSTLPIAEVDRCLFLSHGIIPDHYTLYALMNPNHSVSIYPEPNPDTEIFCMILDKYLQDANPGKWRQVLDLAAPHYTDTVYAEIIRERTMRQSNLDFIDMLSDNPFPHP